jgi:hypothetical protein
VPGPEESLFPMVAEATTSMSWGSAIVRAAIVIVMAVVVFVLVPDRLLAYLSLHIVPFWRDVLMLCYVGVAFVLASWIFIRIQRVRA